MKLDSHFNKISLNDLHEFRFNISKILKVSPYVVRLCCIEKGCIRLTFQIPYFVRQRSFPLTSEQKDSLLQLGVLSLICGDYEFTPTVAEVGYLICVPMNFVVVAMYTCALPKYIFIQNPTHTHP